MRICEILPCACLVRIQFKYWSHPWPSPLNMRICEILPCACLVRIQFKYWSPLPSEPEKRLPVDPETATASCSASLARLAVTGGVHVGWKSTTTGAGIVTWQVRIYSIDYVPLLRYPDDPRSRALIDALSRCPPNRIRGPNHASESPERAAPFSLLVRPDDALEFSTVLLGKYL